MTSLKKKSKETRQDNEKEYSSFQVWFTFAIISEAAEAPETQEEEQRSAAEVEEYVDVTTITP